MKIFRDLFSQYEAMGIDEVWVEANMSVGGYTWGKYGFSAKKFDAENIVIDAYKRGKIGEDAYTELINAIQSHDGEYFPMNVISNKEYGKDILLKTKWDGRFSLHDKKQMEVLKDYIKNLF